MTNSNRDDVLQKEIWRGEVPIEYVLADGEVAVMSKPNPFYQLVPRISYLPFYLQEVKDYFAPSAVKVGQENSRLWLSYNNIPVRWHLPMGVLYDIIKKGVDPSESQLLQLTVHFTAFPDGQLIRLHTEEELRFFFNHSMKEAACIKFGSAKPIITLSTGDVQELCEAVRDCHSRHSSYKKIREKIERLTDGQIEKLPVRLFVGNARDPVDKFRILLRAPRRDLTLGQLLQHTLPQHFGEPLEDMAVSPQATAYLHGVVPMAAMPLRFMATNCSNPDFWINVVVIVNRDPTAT